MSMYEELVETVRLCMGQPCCDNCPQYDNGLDPKECTKKLMLECAEAIEYLILQNEMAQHAIRGLDATCNGLLKENERLNKDLDEIYGD